MNSPGSGFIFHIFQMVLRSPDHAPVVGIWMEKREIELSAVLALGSVCVCVPAWSWSHRHHVHHLTQLSPGQTLVVVWSNVRTIVLEINILRSVCVYYMLQCYRYLEILAPSYKVSHTQIQQRCSQLQSVS